MQLLIFKTVVELKSFSGAAKILHLSQPAISLQIQALEEYYGTRLLDRTNRKVSLTAAGKVLYTYALNILTLHEEAKKNIGEAASLVKGHLHLGATLTLGEYILPRLLGSFTKENPRVEIGLDIANTEHILHYLLENRLDLGLIEGQVNHPDLVKKIFLQDELVIVFPPEHPFASKTDISLEELVEEPIILRESGSGTRQVTENKLAELGVNPRKLNLIMELGSTQAIKEAVRSGLGISILSKWTIQMELQYNLLKTAPIKNAPILRGLYIFYNKHKFQTRTAEAFMHFLEDTDTIKKLLK